MNKAFNKPGSCGRRRLQVTYWGSVMVVVFCNKATAVVGNITFYHCVLSLNFTLIHRQIQQDCFKML